MTTRKVYLEGEMGARFGKEFDMIADSFTEVFQCLKCNFSGFMPYLQECHEKNIGFILEVEGRPIRNEAEALLLYKEGDMIITPLPAGSKSGGAKILAAVAVTVMTAGMGAFAIGAMGGGGIAGGMAGVGSMFGAGFGGIGATLGGMLKAGGALGVLANVGIGLGVNLALAGIQQMMAPDPSTDSQQDESYIFEGSKQNIAEGDPVPVLYGELRVPGRTVSFHTRSEATSFQSFSSGTQYVDTTEETSVGPGLDETEDNITWQDTIPYTDIEFGGSP
jgi:predicted phage tail protein